MRVFRLAAGVATALVLLSTGAAEAQLRFGGTDSNFGSVTLEPGFAPDPHAVAILSGGGLSVGDMDLGPGCVGYVTQDPDYIVNFTGTSNRLRFFVEGDGDTGLVISAPGKEYRCNDDSNGLDPMVTFENAQAGQYNVWVASYSSDDNIDASLYVTELDLEPGSMENSGVTGSLSVGGSSSNFGSATLSRGFMPDPYTVEVTSGGSLSVSAMDLGPGCVGYATADPDFILDYESAASMLRFYMEGDGDTALVINAPDGSWHCNDDSMGLDPMVTFDSPMTGQYDIWVSSYSSDDNVFGTLSITELSSNEPGS